MNGFHRRRDAHRARLSNNRRRSRPRGPRGGLAYVRGENLDDLGVIILRISGDALQGVDTAETNVELGLAKLVDRSCEALSDLASSVEAVRQAGEDGADDGD